MNLALGTALFTLPPYTHTPGYALELWQLVSCCVDIIAIRIAKPTVHALRISHCRFLGLETLQIWNLHLLGGTKTAANMTRFQAKVSYPYATRRQVCWEDPERMKTPPSKTLHSHFFLSQEYEDETNTAWKVFYMKEGPRNVVSLSRLVLPAPVPRDGGMDTCTAPRNSIICRRSWEKPWPFPPHLK